MSRLFKSSYILLIYCFFYLPIAILMIYSFNNSTYSSLWHGFTWHWYVALFHDPSLLTILGHSLLLAFVAASCAALLGSLCAVILNYYKFKSKTTLYTSIFILIILPDLVMGISLLMLFYILHIALGFWTLLIAHITLCLPFVIVTVLGRLSDFDRNIFEAAKDLGASDMIIFLRILLPMLLPAIIAGWLLSFTLSLDDVIISFFVSGPSYQILPLYIYSMVRLGVNPEINALCSLMFIATLFIVAGSQLLLTKRR